MLDKRTIRCDLAIDMAEAEGLGSKIESDIVSGKYGVKREVITIKNQADEERTGVKRGRYVTLTRRGVYAESDDEKIYFQRCLAKAIRETVDFLDLDSDITTLVLGLGNGYMTSDALGKNVCEGIITTRRPGEPIKNDVDKIKEVCAFHANVCGVTGVESSEVARGLVNEIKPDLVICADSLCAFRADRIGRSYQITTRGIKAGSGAGNTTGKTAGNTTGKTAGKSVGKEISEETLGVPVVAIGVPFVISARRLIRDASGGDGGFDPVSPEEDMFVTYRDVDAILKECSSVISASINLALQPGLSVADVLSFS